MTKKMKELNDALKLVLDGAEGAPDMFAFLLTAPLAGWMAQGMLDEDSAMAAIGLLHRLHPSVQV